MSDKYNEEDGVNRFTCHHCGKHVLAGEMHICPGTVVVFTKNKLASVTVGWNKMETAPKDGSFVFLIFEDGDIALARHDGEPSADHNGWWDMSGLDFGHGHSTAVGWLPRDVLPETPSR